MSLFTTAAQSALTVAQAYMGETVTYARGEASVSVTALRIDAAVTVEETAGVFVRVVTTEWHVRAADLVLSAAAATPADGDTITDAAGRVYRYVSGHEYLPDTAEWRIPTGDVSP